MALYETHNFTTGVQFLQDFAAFALANGWTVDRSETYQSTNWRIHIHKGAAHFELRSSATAVRVSSCTGYDSLADATGQPGYNGAERSFANTVGETYTFVSTVGAIYFTRAKPGDYEWGGLFVIQDKIGTWADGFGFQVPDLSLFGVNCYSSAGGFGQIYYDGQWSGLGVAANGLSGVNSLGDVVSKQPSVHNAGVVPLSSLLMLILPEDTAKRIPLGFAPGVFRARTGNLYEVGDQLLIGADTYLVQPFANRDLFAETAGAHFFKLGA